MTRPVITVLGVVMLIALVPTAGVATGSRAAMESCLSAAGLELATGETPTISGVEGIGINPGNGPLMPGDLSAGVFVYGSEEEARSAAAGLAGIPFHDVVQEGAIIIVYAEAPSPKERSAIEGCVAVALSGGKPGPSEAVAELTAAPTASPAATPPAAPTPVPTASSTVTATETAAPTEALASPPVATDIGRGPLVVEASALEALCRQNAPDRRTRNACLGIVREVLAPFGQIVLAADQGPGTVDQPGIGGTLETPTLYVTLLGVDWQPEGVFSSPGSTHLVAEVEFVSRDPDAWVSGVSGFTAVDAERYAYPAMCLDQCLLGGPLTMGRKMKGHVAFEVPEDVQRLDLEYAQAPGIGFDHVVWTIERPEGPPIATQPASGFDTMMSSYLCYDLATATMIIEVSGLTVGTVMPEAPTSDDSWLVRSQSPAPGIIVPAGTTVDLVVADPSEPCPGA